ncbi:UNVERIFIED_CONTAM: hypothetical protein GTU68_031940 [Idotea baltica]|nr:hypothetical protein [Idotea baltica]
MINWGIFVKIFYIFKYYILNKPYGYHSQFSGDGILTLKDLAEENKLEIPTNVYPVGRLDKDSEGLLILTNDKKLHTYLLNPKHGHKRTYWTQLDNTISNKAIKELESGVTIKLNKKDYKTLPAKVKLINKPNNLWKRTPPVRFRKEIPTSWIELTLTEGKNRQVRRMTATVGFPTLRLIRCSIEKLMVDEVKNGEVKEVDEAWIKKMLNF